MYAVIVEKARGRRAASGNLGHTLATIVQPRYMLLGR